VTRREPRGRRGGKPRRSLRARLLGALWSWLLRLQAATWEVRTEGVGAFDRALSGGRRLLAAFWHGKYVALFPLMRGRGVLIFASTSHRGDVVAEICGRFGYRCAQIPDHGREHSLDLMREALADETAGAVVVDGPLGPHRVVKRGVVVIASEQRRVVFPVSVAASRKKVFGERWDRREIPKLFSRVALVFGDPLEVPADLEPPEEDRWRERVRQALEAVDARAEQRIAAWGASG